MFSLRSVHVFFIGLSVVLASGLGMWGLLNQYPVLGALSLCFAALLVAYGGYFVWKAENAHLN
jgi:hypothetical protein